MGYEEGAIYGSFYLIEIHDGRSCDTGECWEGRHD